MTMRKRCGSCEFADLLHAGSVECRRMPPQPYCEPTGRISNIRPRVGQEYWCGEFRQRPNDDLFDLRRMGVGESGVADVRAAAAAVLAFDWSDNDADAVAAIERLRQAMQST